MWFSIDSWYSNGYHLCAFSHRPISLFLWISHHAGISKIWSHNFTIHNIPDVFSLNNSKLYDCAHCIYLAEPEIKDTTDIAISTSYINLQIATDGKDWLRMKLSEKRDDYNFPLWTFHLYVATFEFLEHLYMERIYLWVCVCVCEYGPFALITIQSCPHSCLISWQE